MQLLRRGNAFGFISIFALLIPLVLMFSTTALAEIFGDYVGWETCDECHDDVVEAWEKTPHAHAFATLAEQGEEKQENPGCVKCHVVAFDKDGGFIDMELTPELKDVQCESCHGPGLEHSEEEEAYLIVGSPDESVCRECHTPEQDQNFNFEEQAALVHELVE